MGVAVEGSRLMGPSIAEMLRVIDRRYRLVNSSSGGNRHVVFGLMRPSEPMFASPVREEVVRSQLRCAWWLFYLCRVPRFL